MIFEKQFWKELFSEFSNDDVTGLAAQLSYFFLLSLFPLLIFLLSLVSFLPVTQEDIFNMLQEYLPPNTQDLIQNNVQQVIDGGGGGLLSFSIIGTIWSASVGVNALLRSFNRAYEIEETRSFIVARTLSIGLTLLVLFLIAVALMIPVFGRVLGENVFGMIGLSEQFVEVWFIIRWILTALILIVVLTILFFIGPNKKLKLVHTLPGATVATIGWMLTSWGFSYYVSNFGNYSATYGSLGGIIVLMVWLFLSGMMIIIGGEVNAILDRNNRRLLSRKKQIVE
ncbi:MULTISPECIES: YihY/virulence factor BrkB family protein [Allobacillus]|uniref:YihY/virulence factor BrkB family protein n=1 Tax=Allobacillus halotolerans TaxID=570278 RepID=A0ABS6GR64_9BACI|nr:MULTISPECIES: YihY/virulence factor BrkB family protein [Allobacillus]MBU6081600.1 YihY/virulence factor BrkB family protein [Allobacillus halotolerans]TSJ66923.1 YihY/virulence factor BrkB family protein [Allobacillus sp. SKP2-8]